MLRLLSFLACCAVVCSVCAAARPIPARPAPPAPAPADPPAVPDPPQPPAADQSPPPASSQPQSRFAPPPDSEAAPARRRQRGAPGRELVLMFTGDNKLCGRTAQQIAQRGPDYPFQLVAATLGSADLAFGNCEGSITDCAVHSPGKPDSEIAAGHAFIFKSDPRTSGPIFSAAGYDIMQLANNHAMDYGAPGLLDTCAALDAAGIAYVGAGPDYAAASAPVVLTAKGVRVGFLAYSLIVPPYSAARAAAPGLNALPAAYAQALRSSVAALRAQCDIVVVGFHWGKEGTSVPNALQRAVGHSAIDAGADLVIGGHPHTFQGTEFYGNGVIAYSMGNFCFSGASAQIASGILRVSIDPGGPGAPPQLDAVALLPCWVRAGRPEPSADVRLHSKLDGVMRATGSRLAAAGESSGGWLAISPAP